MTTDTTHRAEAARRTAAASGDGALALLEACKENVALRRRVAELEASRAETLRPCEDHPDSPPAWSCLWCYGAAQKQVDETWARATAAEERARALCDYVHHVDGCEVWFDGANGKPCTCGLAPLLEKP